MIICEEVDSKFEEWRPVDRDSWNLVKEAVGRLGEGKAIRIPLDEFKGYKSPPVQLAYKYVTHHFGSGKFYCRSNAKYVYIMRRKA